MADLPEGNGLYSSERAPQWYMLTVRHHHEKRVRDRLEAKGIECFLPTVARLAQWGDRKKKISAPLFPGCCFVRFKWKDRLDVLADPGVPYDGAHKPLPISDEEIAVLRQLIEGGIVLEPCEWTTEGTQVTIAKGPLAGLQGLLVQDGQYHRFIIQVPILSQALAMPIEASDVSLMKQS